MKTYVFLTIDTEVSMGYAWGDSDLEPLDTDTCVWCRQPNGKEYGIGMIMGILEKFGLKGVFFVDASIHENFGAGPFHEICGSILDRGHDLQLHLHPAAWQYAILRRNGPVQGRPAEVRDLLHCYDRGMQESFIEKACNVFEKACGQRPTAFRAGSFGADETTLTAIARAGIPADFSSNAALMGVTCKVGGKSNRAFRVAGITEIPVSQIMGDRWPGTGYKPLDINSLSLQEIRSALLQFHAGGQRSACIVAHSSSLLKNRSGRWQHARPDWIVRRRLEGLASFLAAHSDKFEAGHFSHLVRRSGWLEYIVGGEQVWPGTNLAFWAKRNIEQLIGIL